MDNKKVTEIHKENILNWRENWKTIHTNIKVKEADIEELTNIFLSYPFD